jgi:hypothetical protein
MTTIIMLFILPLGIIFYFFDKKTKKTNKMLFDDYVVKIKASDLTQKEKLDSVDKMYYLNGYKIVHKTQSELVVEKKHFNLGVLFIFFGLLSYFGLPLYYIYYRFILKPEKISLTFEP